MVSGKTLDFAQRRLPGYVQPRSGPRFEYPSGVHSPALGVGTWERYEGKALKGPLFGLLFRRPSIAILKKLQDPLLCLGVMMGVLGHPGELAFQGFLDFVVAQHKLLHLCAKACMFVTKARYAHHCVHGML